MRFIQFLSEVTIDIDDETAKNPAAVAAKAREVSRKASRNPGAVTRDAKVAARAERQVAQAGDSPTKALDIRIAKTKETLANLTQQRQRLVK